GVCLKLEEWEETVPIWPNNPGDHQQAELLGMESEVRVLFEKLTKREWQVAEQIAYGLSNKEISIVLNISEHTVKNHISNIFNKLNMDDRTQLAAMLHYYRLRQAE